MIRKLILGKQASFGKLPSWRFVTTDHVFANPQDPFNTIIPELKDLDPFEADATIDFVAIKIGDVNEDATVNGIKSGEVR